MNIGLIGLSGVRVKSEELAALGVTLPGFVRRGKVIASLPSLGLLTVAGLTPAGHDVSYIEIPGAVTPDALPDFDLVGISSLTARVEEAYRAADIYRGRGVATVLGGLHATSMTSEALEHFDTVVTGGAEGVWPRLVRDAELNRLQRIYEGARAEVFSPGFYARPRFDFLAGREYNRVTVQTSRGCPRGCEFCGASPLITTGYNQKPVELVIDEIREAKRYIAEPFFEFADDNTFLNRTWSRRFLKELARENIHFFTETDASVADDPELCDLLADAGCKQLLIGLESPKPADLDGIDPVSWKKSKAPNYHRVVEVLQTRGVSVNGCFILGLDNHTPEIFPEVLEFVRSSGLAEVQYTVLTPFPGTALYARLAREGRLLQERFWDACTLFDVNYRPARMTVEELNGGMKWLFENTYDGHETSLRLRNFVRMKRGGGPSAS